LSSEKKIQKSFCQPVFAQKYFISRFSRKIFSSAVFFISRFAAPGGPGAPPRP